MISAGSLRRLGAAIALLAIGALLGGCATGVDKLRKDRDSGLKDGDFLAALRHSREIYQADAAALPDLAAHCGLVFAVANYTEARQCIDKLLVRLDGAEAAREAELQREAALQVTSPGRAMLSGEFEAMTRGGVVRDGRLIPDWRDTRFGVENRLVIDNLRWRALYLRGKVALETGDFAGAVAELDQARALVATPRAFPGGSLTLEKLLDGRERWRFQDLAATGADEARSWWIDLLSALAVAASANGDAATAQQAIADLQRLDPPRQLAGYKQSRLAYAQMAAGNLAAAKTAADADPEQFRRALRVGGGILSASLLIWGVVAFTSVAAAPGTGVGAIIASAMAAATAAAALVIGATLSVLTLTVSRVAGQDTTWDLTQRWYAVAKISRLSGDHERADKTYAKLLEHDTVLQSQPAIQWQVYADVGERHEEAGRDDDAIAMYEKAIEVVEATRRNIAAEAAKIGFIADKQRVYRRLMQLRLKRGQVDEAFELSERARSRALLDVLAGRDWTAGADVSRVQGGEMVRQIEAHESEARLAILLDKPKETSTRRSAIDRLGARLQAQEPELAALTHMKRYRGAEIRERLAAGEALVSFVSTGDELVAFAMSRDRVWHWTASAAGVGQGVERLRQAIERKQPLADDAAALARQLFGGLAAGHELRQLTIVPSGSLHALPFAALQSDAGPLPAGVALRVLPSASVLPLMQSRVRPAVAMSVTAFGNPDFGGLFPALPNTGDEARDVAAIVGSGRALLGREASKANALRHAGASTVLHFATHGQFDAQRPLQSALFLSDGAGGVARLTASEFYGLRIAARLVTLSACETGLGSVRSGDEVIGLYRALMFAGADTIVASLWEVDDESTAQLMTRFYAHLKTHPAPQALRLAQRDTAQRWPHPYHWAGFAVIGLDAPFSSRGAAAGAP